MAASPRRAILERRLADSEGPFRAVFDGSIDALLIADDSRRYLDANPAACELLGGDRALITKFRIDDFASRERRGEIEAVWRSFLQTGKQKGEYELVRLDGDIRHVEFTATANFIPGRHLSSLRDITDRKKAEESLRVLSGRLLQLKDEEQRRIARDLHDSAGQILTLLKMNLVPLEVRLEKEHPEFAKPVAQSIALVDQLTSEIRTLSHLLHPPLLDELGLPAALHWYVDEFAKRSKIKVDLDYPPNYQRLPREVETALFRIVQECLTNIHRHSGSPTASIRFRQSSSEITCEVKDEGKGMPPQHVSNVALPAMTGIGLSGMQERVRQLGGNLTIDSNSYGTAIIARVPFSQDRPPQLHRSPSVQRGV
jgi:PAS domain S-box-containing protein